MILAWQACASFKQATDSSAEKTNGEQGIVFHEFKALYQNQEINFLDLGSTITPGRIKEIGAGSKAVLFPMEVMLLNGDQQIIKRQIERHPLIRNYEYADDGRLNQITTALDSARFTLRYNHHPNIAFIRLVSIEADSLNFNQIIPIK